MWISAEVGVHSPARLSGASRYTTQQGDITVFVKDPPTGKVVWYGWAEKSITESDTPETAIADAVDALFDGRITNAPN